MTIIAENDLTESPCRILGFEIKVSRNDWLREYNNPDKSAKFVDKCNEFYIVTPSNVVDSKDEVPDGWGWFNADYDRRVAGVAVVRSQVSIQADGNFNN